MLATMVVSTKQESVDFLLMAGTHKKVDDSSTPSFV
jgi:hypothetical protein